MGSVGGWRASWPQGGGFRFLATQELRGCLYGSLGPVPANRRIQLKVKYGIKFCATTVVCLHSNCEFKKKFGPVAQWSSSHMYFSCVTLETLEQPTAVYFNVAGIGRSRVTSHPRTNLDRTWLLLCFCKSEKALRRRCGRAREPSSHRLGQFWARGRPSWVIPKVFLLKESL